MTDKQEQVLSVQRSEVSAIIFDISSQLPVQDYFIGNTPAKSLGREI